MKNEQPEKPDFDKAWIPGDSEKVKNQVKTFCNFEQKNKRGQR
jgi:hypothetical protein